MKVHLVYLDTDSIYPPHFSCGLGSVAAVIRNAGHEPAFSYIRNDEDADMFVSRLRSASMQAASGTTRHTVATVLRV